MIEIKDINFEPGKRLFNKPLADEIADILDATGRVEANGNRWRSTYRIVIEGNKTLYLVQENRPASQLLQASIIFHTPDLILTMDGISKICLNPGFREVSFIQRIIGHEQSVSIRKSMSFSQTKTPAEALVFLKP